MQRVQIGINTWVWTSPLTTETLEELAPRAAEMGFDSIELAIEGTCRSRLYPRCRDRA